MIALAVRSTLRLGESGMKSERTKPSRSERRVSDALRNQRILRTYFTGARTGHRNADKWNSLSLTTQFLTVSSYTGYFLLLECRL
eukprot:3178851-Amphidinium_carterae.1